MGEEYYNVIVPVFSWFMDVTDFEGFRIRCLEHHVGMG
jgi:hypothetical protein